MKKLHEKGKAFFSIFHSTFPSFLNNGTHISILHSASHILEPTLRESLGWRGTSIISHERKRKCVWEREQALGHLLRYSPATALLLAVGRTRLVMRALLPERARDQGRWLTSEVHLPSLLSLGWGLRTDMRHEVNLVIFERTTQGE